MYWRYLYLPTEKSHLGKISGSVLKEYRNGMWNGRSICEKVAESCRNTFCFIGRKT